MTPAAASHDPHPDPRFPIGPWQNPTSDEPVSPDQLDSAIAALAELPEQLRNALHGFHHDQLDTPYREGGWTVRQVVHHIADAHMNAFVRVRLALTEDWPHIVPFQQDAWARLPDAHAPVEWSLELIESLHARWVMTLQALTPEQMEGRGFIHAERGRVTVAQAALLYSWHSRHHLAHITHLRAARGW